MIDETIGRYRVLARLGEGDTGSLWLAEDPVLGRSVALRLLPPHVAASADSRQRLLAEARTASAVHHPGLAAVYEAGEDRGRVFIAFEHVDGRTVAERLKRDGPFPVPEALRIARDAAAALGHAHASGVFHRDVTSRTVMLDRHGQVKIVGLGAALPGETADARPDLKGLGALLYEMLLGRGPPADGAAAPSVGRPEISPELDGIVLRALGEDPGFSGAPALTRALAALEGTARREQAAPRPKRRLRAGLLAAALVAVGAATAVWWGDRPPEARFRSVAVLPLRIEAQQAGESTYLATGLADALVTRLGRVAELRVTPWVTSRRYPPDGLPIPVIGQELDVESLVVGSFREQDGNLELKLSLLDRKTGRSVWSAEFTDARSGLLELQEVISLALAHGIRGRLTAQDEKALGRRPTDHADAYDHYLRGTQALHESSRESREKGLAHFETALAIDPGLVEAHAGVGAAHLYGFSQGWAGDGSVEQAVASFRRALEVDPGNLPAIRGLIRVSWVSGHAEECLRLARVVRDGDRFSLEALLAQAEALLYGGFAKEALPLLITVCRQDPAHLQGHRQVVLAHSWAGDIPFEVSCDFSTFAGSLTPGQVFVVHGVIYPAGTLQSASDGFNGPNDPTYPSSEIGTWSCYGMNRSDNPLATCTDGAHLIAMELFEFNSDAASFGLPGEGDIITNGIHTCQDSVPYYRVIVGGTGDYVGIWGQDEENHIGMNGTGGSNWTHNMLLGAPPPGGTVAAPLVERPSFSTMLGLGRPNPFGEAMQFDLTSSAPGRYRVDVFDVTGRLVRTLFDAPLEEEVRTLRWDGKDAAGRSVTPGTYFYRAVGPNGTMAQKSTVLR